MNESIDKDLNIYTELHWFSDLTYKSKSVSNELGHQYEIKDVINLPFFSCYLLLGSMKHPERMPPENRQRWS